MKDDIREAFEEGFALSKLGGPLATAWERSEARQRAAVDFDLSNHHNALTCPYCNPKRLTLAEPVEGK